MDYRIKIMKVVWLCQYPIELLHNIPSVYRDKKSHPSTWIVNLSNGIVKNNPNIELHIITETTYIKKSFIIEQNGIIFHIIRSGSSIPFLLRGYPKYLPLDVILKFYFNKIRMLNEVRKINPDIIHSHGTEFAYSLTAVKSGYPTIISIQGIISKLVKYNINFRYDKIKQLEINTIKDGKYFIAKTPFAGDFIKSVNPGAQIFNIENPVNELFFTVKRKIIQRKVLFVGSIIKEKGIEDLIDAFKFVVNAELIIIGTGKPSYVNYLKEKIFEANIERNIKWLGYRGSIEIAEEFETTTMLVLPSYMETSPNVIAEAMSAGVPVIGTKVGGIPYMIEDGKNGFLVEPQNHLQLSEKINIILNDNTLISEMGKRNKERIIPFSNKVKDTLLCYFNLTGKPVRLAN